MHIILKTLKYNMKKHVVQLTHAFKNLTNTFDFPKTTVPKIDDWSFVPFDSPPKSITYINRRFFYAFNHLYRRLLDLR